jgi:hypothetical protein
MSLPTRTRLHHSELAVPGSNVRMLERAPKLGADIVMLDLEDAVAPDDKPQARRNVIDALNECDWVSLDGRLIDVASIRMAENLLTKLEQIQARDQALPRASATNASAIGDPSPSRVTATSSVSGAPLSGR